CLGTSRSALLFSPKITRYFRRNLLCKRAGDCLNLIGSFDRFRFSSSMFRCFRHVHGYFI
ncbi:hypothetical protein LINPERPRIM_LOCUS32876, partial [Linum perenne]